MKFSMGDNSADQFFPRSPRPQSRASARARMPSSTGYLISAIVIALGLFFGLWWILVSVGDEAPWLPAGLAASVVLLVALSAREVVMRRAWTRYLLENGINQKPSSHSRERSRTQKRGFSASLHSAALRAIQKQSSVADAPGANPELHLDVAHMCQDYLASTDEAIRSGSYGSEKGIAIRAGQERVRALHRHHLVTWARGHSQALARECLRVSSGPGHQVMAMQSPYTFLTSPDRDAFFTAITAGPDRFVSARQVILAHMGHIEMQLGIRTRSISHGRLFLNGTQRRRVQRG